MSTFNADSRTKNTKLDDELFEAIRNQIGKGYWLNGEWIEPRVAQAGRDDLKGAHAGWAGRIGIKAGKREPLSVYGETVNTSRRLR